MSEPRILLVEDNHINQLVAQKILAKAGLSADVADSGEKALEKLSTQSYELVLMDVRLPGIDGIETSRRIRSRESDVLDHSVPIIALTAYASDEDQATCITAGMDDYLSKPLDIDAFLDLVRRYVQSADNTGEAASGGTGPGASPPDTRHRATPFSIPISCWINSVVTRSWHKPPCLPSWASGTESTSGWSRRRIKRICTRSTALPIPSQVRRETSPPWRYKAFCARSNPPRKTATRGG